MSETAPQEFVYIVAVDNHTEGLSAPLIAFKTEKAANDFVRRADVYGMVTRRVIPAEVAE